MATTDAYPVDATSSSTSKDSVWMSSWYSYIIAVFVVIIIVGLFGNGLSILAFFRHMTKKTVTDYLICSLSFSDFFTLLSIMVLIFFAYTEYGIPIASYNKGLTSLFAVSYGIVSSLTMVLMLSIQRLMAVFTPVTFRTQSKKKALLVFVFFPWCLNMVCVSLPFFGWNSWVAGKRCILPVVYTPSFIKCFIFAPFLFILLTIPLLQTATFICLVRQQKRVQVACQPSGETLTQISTKKHLQVSQTLLIVVVALYACILPFIAMLIAQRVIEDLFVHHPAVEVIAEITKLLVTLSCALNPLIHAQRNQRFRDAFCQMFRICKIRLRDSGLCQHKVSPQTVGND